MSRSQTPGDNLPRYLETQLEFAAHIRDPLMNSRPAGVEARRMQVYIDLFYNNIENFLANTFPITKRTLGAEPWHGMARGFLASHQSTSPYFQEIPQEFLEFLDERRDWVAEFPYLLELCHYEWVELALDVSDATIDYQGVDPDGDLLAGVPVLSGLAWSLRYEYPVHRISSRYRPTTRPEAPTYLVVYRSADDTVGFIESNEVTARLLTLLGSADAALTGRQVLETIAAELSGSDASAVMAGGSDTLRRLRSCDIILGTRTP